MVNTANFKKLRDAVASDDFTYNGGRVNFNMLNWLYMPYNSCGTSACACLGGHCNILAGERVVQDGSDYSAMKARKARASKWLGITNDEGELLFFPDGIQRTREQALAQLDFIIETEVIVAW